MNFLANLLQTVWALLESMAPWLLVGFVLAGVLSELVPVAMIQKHLSKKSWLSILKAVLIGVPLPLCSCGVIPVAATLRKAGASKGGVAAFTASTPQTGVDSIATTYSLMGLPFTLGRIAADVISGLLAGSLINFFDRSQSPTETKEETSCCGGCCSGENEGESSEVNSESNGRGKARSMLRSGLVSLPGEIGFSLLVGVLLGALLTVAVPENLLQQLLHGNRFLTYAVVTLISIPIYACSVGSIPVAFGLLAAGISPGAAIVFLVTGPATNMATVTTLVKLIGKSSTVIYIASLVVGAWSVGLVFDLIGVMPSVGGTHVMDESRPLGFAAAVVLVVVLLNAFRLKKRTSFDAGN